MPIQFQLYNGDCLEIMQLIPDKSVDMVLCDPPYGITACKWDSPLPLDLMWQHIHRITKPESAICIFGAEPFSSTLRMSNIREFKYDWIYEKTKAGNFLNAKNEPLRAHEIVSVFYRKRPKYNPQFLFGDKPYRKREANARNVNAYRQFAERGHVHESKDGRRYPRSVIKFHNSNIGSNHPTEKPVDLLEYLIRTYTDEGDTVLDFTMGSGSTGVACVNTRRNFIGIELNADYFRIAERRINGTATKGATVTEHNLQMNLFEEATQ